MKIVAILLFVLPVVSQATESFSGYRFIGVVKGLHIGNQVHVSLLNLSSGAVNKKETVILCEIDKNTANNNLIQELKIDMLREALNSGAKVQLSYNSGFDRCLREFSIL